MFFYLWNPNPKANSDAFWLLFPIWQWNIIDVLLVGFLHPYFFKNSSFDVSKERAVIISPTFFKFKKFPNDKCKFFNYIKKI